MRIAGLFATSDLPLNWVKVSLDDMARYCNRGIVAGLHGHRQTERYELLAAHPAVIGVVADSSQHRTGKQIERAFLLLEWLTKADPPDIVLYRDEDELYPEAHFEEDLMRFYDSPALCLSMRMIDMWGDLHTVRVDGIRSSWCHTKAFKVRYGLRWLPYHGYNRPREAVEVWPKRGLFIDARWPLRNIGYMTDELKAKYWRRNQRMKYKKTHTMPGYDGVPVVRYDPERPERWYRQIAARVRAGQWPAGVYKFEERPWAR